jgi:hypothetical protein
LHRFESTLLLLQGRSGVGGLFWLGVWEGLQSWEVGEPLCPLALSSSLVCRKQGIGEGGKGIVGEGRRGVGRVCECGCALPYPRVLL